LVTETNLRDIKSLDHQIIPIKRELIMRKLLLALPLVLLLAGVSLVQAADPVVLPTLPAHPAPPFVYHLDPVLPVVDWAIAPAVGPAGRVVVPFADALASPAEPWHWETEWVNNGAAPIVMPIIFRGPGAGFPVAGVLTVAPATSVVIEFVFNEAPEVGAWKYGMIPMVGNPAFDHDASVCEKDDHGPPPLPPELVLDDLAVIEAMDHTEVIIGPENIPTLSTWGLMILLLLLVTAGVFTVVRRRRVEA
jgi:hypothetical protein